MLKRENDCDANSSANRAERRPSYASLTTLAGLVWGSLAFGGVYPWAYWPLLVLCSTAGLLGFCRPGWSNSELRSLVFGCVGLVAVVLLQLAPLPRATEMALSPASFRIFGDRTFESAVEATAPNQAAPPATDRRPLSINPHATWRGLAFVVGFALFLIGTARVLDTYQTDWIIRGTVALSVALASVGIAQLAQVSGKIYGLWPPYYGGGVPFGSFANHNHFAGWMLMALPLAVGYFFGRLNHARPATHRSVRERVLWWSSREANQLILIGLAIFLMGLSLVMTGSRSGIGSGALALLIFAHLAVKSRTSRRRRLLLNLFLILLATLSVAWAGVGTTIDRFATSDTIGLEGRAGIWRDTIQVIGQFPIVGTGLNTYSAAIAVYRSNAPYGSVFEAHNDYLQLAAEGGLVLGVAIGALLLIVVSQVRQRLRQCVAGSMEYWMRVGAAVGLVAIAVQELVDFSLQIPANALLFVLLCSIAVHPSSIQRPVRVIA